MIRMGILVPLVLLQMILGARVLWRLVRTAGGPVIEPREIPARPDDQVSVIVPVLNEQERISACLDGLIVQGDEVTEILVVDGGSDDETQARVRRYSLRDPRVRWLDASPVAPDWNGKAWNLQVGLERAANPWVLTIDADVHATPLLTRSLLAHAHASGLDALSVATRQEIAGTGQGLIHPSLLTTLVYRFGIPGGVIRRVSEVQANGQCFLARRDVLKREGGFAAVRESICEDVTIARRLVAQGYRLGFFEAGDLVSVQMYADWRATWRNWPRSLPMRDRYFGLSGVLGLLEVLLVQALPLPLLVLFSIDRRVPQWMVQVNRILAVTRLGVLFGTARVYTHRPRSYWLSPLCDLPSAILLYLSAVRRSHVWRGQVVVRGGNA